MGVNKVIYGNNTLMDISDTTATAGDVASGKYFYTANGIKTYGIFQGYKRWTYQDITPTSNTKTLYLNEDANFNGRKPRCIIATRASATNTQYTNTTTRILAYVYILDNDGNFFNGRYITYKGATSGSNIAVTSGTSVESTEINSNLVNSYLSTGSASDDIYFWSGFMYRVFIGG